MALMYVTFFLAGFLLGAVLIPMIVALILLVVTDGKVPADFLYPFCSSGGWLVTFGVYCKYNMYSDIIFGIIGGAIFLIIARNRLLNSEETTLKEFGTIKIPKGSEFQYINNVVNEMAIASGLGFCPEVYIVENDVANAFALGINPKKSKIVLTSKLVKMLDRNELQGVVGHEIAHIKNLDCKLMTTAFIMLFVTNASLNCLLDTNSRLCHGSGKKPVHVIIILFILTIIFSIFFVPVTRIIYSMLSKRREFLADGCAVQYTRYPEGLMRALQKISSVTLLESYNKKQNALNTICIVPTFAKAKGDVETHPPIAQRIAVLTKMGGSGLADYNTSYKKVTGKNITKDITGFTNQEIITAVTAAAAVSTEMTLLEKHRAVGKIFEKAAEYIEINCDCETKLKIPTEYIGKTLACPHCNKEYKVKKEDVKSEMPEVS